MRCYCCGKETDQANGWHGACVKRFFGTSELPAIDISAKSLRKLAKETVGQGATVTGVQKKLSLHLSKEGEPRLTLVNCPAGYILKPQADDYESLPELEYLVMDMARATGINVVPFSLVQTADECAYITKRVDRDGQGFLLAMEDFCQLEGRLTEDKYRGSYERCGKIIDKYSSRPGVDKAEFFLRLVFSFAVGNSDMHLKNFSLVETASGSRTFVLSPAYDLLPVNVIVPSDLDEMALALNGKKRNIRRKDFLELAKNLGLTDKTAEGLIKKVVKMQDKYVSLCKESFAPEEMKEKLIALMEERTTCIK